VLRRFLPRRLQHEEEATLVEHLSELRHRIFIALLAIVPGFVLGYMFHEEIIEHLIDLMPEGTELVTLGVTEPFFTSIKVSFFVGIAIAIPVLLWQAWAFLAPAMSPSTQRAIVVLAAMGTGLFFAGMAFMYGVVLPRALDFLINYDAELYESQVRANYYLSFVTFTMLAGGVAFLMPIFILALVRIGVISSATLRQNRRIGYVSMLVFAILLPTVDPVSLAFEIVPLIVLYELSIWMSVVMERRWEQRDREYWESFESS
jgi:sec-independent protein translocase protein TatC